MFFKKEGFVIIKSLEEIETFLHHLEVVKLGPADGTETYESVKTIFKAGFSASFERSEIVFSGVTPERDIVISELVQGGEFADFLGNTTEKLERRRVLGSQFVKFCRDYPEKLCKGGKSNFAVLTKKDAPVDIDTSNVLITCVFVLGGGELSSCLFKFNNTMKWDAEYRHRVIYPLR